jgi:hypothetical protein
MIDCVQPNKSTKTNITIKIRVLRIYKMSKTEQNGAPEILDSELRPIGVELRDRALNARDGYDEADLHEENAYNLTIEGQTRGPNSDRERQISEELKASKIHTGLAQGAMWEAKVYYDKNESAVQEAALKEATAAGERISGFLKTPREQAEFIAASRQRDEDKKQK